jgi:Ras-related GTP-binding protein C/D
MSPHETLFRLEATQSLERALVDHTPLCRFTIHDFPGDYYGQDDGELEGFSNGGGGGGENSNDDDHDDHVGDHHVPSANAPPNNNKSVFESSAPTSLIFVVDAQDEPYDHVLQSFTTAVMAATRVNPQVSIEVFINKVDGELFLSDESKYDCRRDVMTQVSDELSDAGVAPDSLQIRYHLTSIYDHSIYEALSRVVQRLIPQLPTLENLLNVLVSTCSMEKAYLFDVVSKLYISTDSGPVDMQSVELCSDMIDVVLDVSGIYGLGPQQQHHHPQVVPAMPQADEEEDEAVVDPDSAYDAESASVIRLSNGMVLYLKEVDNMLALVCITRSENFRKKALINFNISCLKRALRALVQKPNNNNNNTSNKDAGGFTTEMVDGSSTVAVIATPATNATNTATALTQVRVAE